MTFIRLCFYHVRVFGVYLKNSSACMYFHENLKKNFKPTHLENRGGDGSEKI